MPTKPGIAVQMNKALVENTLKEKYHKRDILNTIITNIGDKCYICWFLTGSYVDHTHEPVFGGGLGKKG
jgi:hypothetical protein